MIASIRSKQPAATNWLDLWRPFEARPTFIADRSIMIHIKINATPRSIPSNWYYVSEQPSDVTQLATVVSRLCIASFYL